jgi:hypothetical protein
MKFFRNSVIVLLSLMVFITSSSFTVNLHYCAGQLQNISMVQENTDCMMQMASKKPTCQENSEKSTLKKIDTCCQNHQIKAKSDTKTSDVKVKETQNTSSTLATIQNYFSSLFSFGRNSDSEDDQGTDYSLVPILKKGLYILLQQFRN